jgi:hypothetical protein
MSRGIASSPYMGSFEACLLGGWRRGSLDMVAGYDSIPLASQDADPIDTLPFQGSTMWPNPD